MKREGGITEVSKMEDTAVLKHCTGQCALLVPVNNT